MPNRIIKESICTSSEIDQLNPEEEVFFYRLMVNCDDYGRIDARPQLLRAKCFPLKIDKIKDIDIEKWLEKLVEVNLIKLYTVDGKAYLQLTTWEKHQQIRAKKSKYPQPPIDDINRNHLISDDIKCPRNPNPIQSKEEEDNARACAKQEPCQNEAVIRIAEGLEKAGILTPSPTQIEKLLFFVNEGMDIETVEYACEIAALANSRRVDYIESILRNWHNSGVKTKKHAELERQKYESRRKKHPKEIPKLAPEIPVL